MKKEGEEGAAAGGAAEEGEEEVEQGPEPWEDAPRGYSFQMLLTLSDELLREMVIPPIVEEGAAVDATEEAVGGTIFI